MPVHPGELLPVYRPRGKGAHGRNRSPHHAKPEVENGDTYVAVLTLPEVYVHSFGILI